MKQQLYISQKHLGLEIIVTPSTLEYHEITKQPYKTKKKSFKFHEGKLFLTDEKDIKLLDSILDGTCPGRESAPPVGVIKLSMKAIDLSKAIDNGDETSKELEALKEVEGKSQRKGFQGAAK